MFDGFVHPGLVIGTALCAVPLLIHLLNRQRHKPMQWAAMRFVLAAYKRTRRRAQLEDLLLLLLRMAAVALLALAVSRPFLGDESPLAALTESRRDVVLVLDGSASTGYRRDVKSVFERVVERARELVLETDGGRGDRVRLVLAGAHPRLVAWRTPEEALSVLGTLAEPTDEPLDLAAALGEVVRYAEKDAAGTERSALEVRLLSDLQRAAFLPDSPATDDDGAPPILEPLDRLAELGIRVRVEDLGPAEATPPNVTVTAVETLGSLLGPGVPTDVAVTVANRGGTQLSGVRVSLSVDGERRPSQTLEVPARGEAQAVFSIVVRDPGRHVLEGSVEADRLAVDDRRVRVVDVPPPVRCLIVNGEPDLDIELDETGYLAAVLEPPRGDVLPGSGAGAAPFDPRVVEPSALRDANLDLDEYDVVVLANVESVSERLVERLEQHVAGGGALIVTAGDRMLAGRDNLNLRLFRADGSGLLPARIVGHEAIADRRADYYRVGQFEADHPILRFFDDERWRPLLTEVPIYEFARVAPIEGARVLATLDDDEASPLLVERTYDRGKVLLWTTSIDPEWARVAESPNTMVPLVHELVRWAATPSEGSPNLTAGSAWVAEVRSFPRNAFVVRPDGSRRPLEGEPQATGPGRWQLPPVTDTDRVGLYRIEIDGEPAEPFGVQFDAAEGDLERLGSGELAGLHPALVLVGPEGQSRAGDDEFSRKGELWRWLAAFALACLVAETLWAAWIGRRRRFA